jgi:hypothetical protein
MTRSTQQTYIQRLGFQDADRQNQRHGLACEYLAEQLFEQKIFSLINAENVANLASFNHFNNCSVDLSSEQLEKAINKAKKEILSIKEKTLKQISYSDFINVPIKNKDYVNGFADVLIQKYLNVQFTPKSLDGGFFSPHLIDHRGSTTEHLFFLATLGEIKITPEPAENIIQQIKFYREFVSVARVVILVDFDAPDLQRLIKGSDIELYRLGGKFETWIQNRAKPTTKEF